jgi:hypothetical protein
MTTYGLAIAWNWEFDADFVAGIEHACARRGVSTFRIDPHNLQAVVHDLRSGRLAFDVFFDRASDADPAFYPLVEILRGVCRRIFNRHDFVARAVDKSVMHYVLISHGIHVPNSIILPPYATNGDIDLTPEDLERIGVPFVIKPANTTGGGTGVVMNARTLHDVLRARKEHRNDSYLVQEMIVPRTLGGKRAWFRAYWVFGQVLLCWWDDQTHQYSELHDADEALYGLSGLRPIMETIQRACKLDFFSSEVAMTEERKFIVVDYVNEVCDMRLQSKFGNGAPDAVVRRIEDLIARETAQVLHGERAEVRP